MHVQAAIPSPTHGVWHLGPLPIRAYAICIVVGIVVAIWVTGRRWQARGGGENDVWDVAGWAVVFGIVGGRIYHVITDPELYFKAGEQPLNALKIWDGGLGIPGAIALGTLGAWIGCRRHGMRLSSFGDAAVPGVALAQAIGRLGNWFNNELYGRATDVPWKLEIHCYDLTAGHAVTCASGTSTVLGYFQPTFLYELLWNVALAVFLIVVDRRFRLGHGRVFALYAMGYAVGRTWVELLRSDHANHVLGLRVNTWTAIIVFAGGLYWFLTHREPREDSPFLPARAAEEAAKRDAIASGEPDEPDGSGDDGADPDDRVDASTDHVASGKADVDAGPDTSAGTGKAAGADRTAGT